MESIKLTAMSARGSDLMSVNVSPDETYNDIITIFTDAFREYAKIHEGRSLFSLWQKDGYILKEGD